MVTMLKAAGGSRKPWAIGNNHLKHSALKVLPGAVIVRASLLLIHGTTSGDCEGSGWSNT